MQALRERSSSNPLLSLSPLIDSSDLLQVGGRQQLSKSSGLWIATSNHPSWKASLDKIDHSYWACSVIACWSYSACCISCLSVPRCWRKEDHSFYHQGMHHLPSQFSQTSTSNDGTTSHWTDHTWSCIRQSWCRLWWSCSDQAWKCTMTYYCQGLWPMFIFVSLAVKAVHLELVSDLTSEAFIACLRRFIARRGRPSHVTNFVGAACEIKEFFQFLREQETQGAITDFLSGQSIVWKFITQHARQSVRSCSQKHEDQFETCARQC